MWRYLRGNKSCEGPRHIFCVDTETTRVVDASDNSLSREVLRLGVARYFRFERGKPTNLTEFAFCTPDQFWGWLSQRAADRSVNWVFGHSIGFDLRVLGWGGEVDSGRLRLERPPPRSKTAATAASQTRPKTGLLVLDGPPTIVDCWFPGGCQLRLVDSRNYWNTSLAKMGESIGLPKLQMPDPWADDDSWLTYCRRDCEILYNCILDLLSWHREHDLGVFKPTAAGQAMQCYRHRFHTRKIVLHDIKPVKQLERQAYFAGRLACFYHGVVDRNGVGWAGNPSEGFMPNAPRPCGTVYKLDCNSLFPSVMKDYLYPKRLLQWNLTLNKPQQLLPTNLASTIASVSLTGCSEPLAQRINGRVNFCVGNFATHLLGPELQRAVSTCQNVTINAWAEYELADLFSSYVDYFFQLRYMNKLAGRLLYADLCKLMLNSLYGKFAQHSYEWLALPGMAPPEPWHNWCEVDAELLKIREYRSIGDLVQERQPVGDHPTSFTAISAFVTAYARQHMDDYRKIAGWHNCYYQGVDSLFVSRMGLDRLQAAGCIDDGALGKLRLEGESDLTIFRGAGYYLFNGQWVRSSIRRGAREIAIGSWMQDQFESLERSCSKPQQQGVAVRKIVRTIDPERGDCELTPNGWVKPTIGTPCESTPGNLASSCNL